MPTRDIQIIAHLHVDMDCDGSITDFTMRKHETMLLAIGNFWPGLVPLMAIWIIVPCRMPFVTDQKVCFVAGFVKRYGMTHQETRNSAMNVVSLLRRVGRTAEAAELAARHCE